MKKIKLNTAKLQLHKEKITELSSSDLGPINGGSDTSRGPFSCNHGSETSCGGTCPTLGCSNGCPPCSVGMRTHDNHPYTIY